MVHKHSEVIQLRLAVALESKRPGQERVTPRRPMSASGRTYGGKDVIYKCEVNKIIEVSVVTS